MQRREKTHRHRLPEESCVYVQSAQNKRIIFIDFLDTLEEEKNVKVEKCINEPKGVGEKEGETEIAEVVRCFLSS